MRLLLSCIAVWSVCVGCGGTSPSGPSPPPSPNFQGQFTGTFVINGCTETGVFFSGLCGGSRFNVGATFSIELSLLQNQTTVTGTVILVLDSGAPPLGLPTRVTGTFQGLIQSSGHLTATAAMSGFVLLGSTWSRNITTWDTTIAGNNLDGSFTLVYSTTAATGNMTVSATLLRVTRQ